MVTGIIFVVVGLIMILLEFFLPGGIMGAVGALFCVTGLVLFAVGSPSVIVTVVVFIVTIGLLLLLGRYALKRVRSSGVYLAQDQTGFRASAFDEEIVGQEGEVLADLKPSGHVQVGGKRYQAVSRMGYLEKGTKIVVIGGEGAHLIVKKQKV